MADETKKEDIKITYVNEELFKKNPSLKLIDDTKFAITSTLLNSPSLAYYTLISQKTMSETPLMNIGLNTLPIIKALNKQVITVGEFATYFMMKVEDAYQMISTFGFDLTKMKSIIVKLEARRKDYVNLSNSIGEMTINYHGRVFTTNLEELSQMTQISFIELYDAYVKNNFDMSKALDYLEVSNKKIEDMEKLSEVLYVDDIYTPGIVEKYRSMVTKGIACRYKLWSKDLVIGSPRVGFNNVSQYLRLFLINIDADYRQKEYMGFEETLLFLNGIITILHKDSFDVNDLRELVIISETKLLSKDLNTLVFRYLKMRDKSRINLEELVEQEIQKTVRLQQMNNKQILSLKRKDNI